MLTLALDTATPHGRFALAEDGVLLAYRPHNVMGSYADAVLQVIDAVLAAADRRLDAVDLVAVAAGPGSFTGVRIGVATAKTLAWALGAELAGVSTLAAMAADLLATQPERDLAVPVLDARRGEIFAGLYRRRDRWVEALLPPACLAPDRWWELLCCALDDLDGPAFGGDGVALLVGQGEQLRPELAARGLPAPRSWTAAHPATARALALALADPAVRAAAAVSPFALVPRYLRGSDAEIKRRLDATPAVPSANVDIHTGAGFRIRLGEPTDLVAVDRIERASFDDPWSRPLLLQELVPSSLRLPLVVECGGALAGYLMAWRSGGELHILNVAVDPARRRHGLGAALLEAALAEARRSGLVAVTLEVRPANRAALALYRAYGFEDAGLRPGYYADTGEDALVLTLELTRD